jgi:hypothetical protein
MCLNTQSTSRGGVVAPYTEDYRVAVCALIAMLNEWCLEEWRPGIAKGCFIPSANGARASYVLTESPFASVSTFNSQQGPLFSSLALRVGT